MGGIAPDEVVERFHGIFGCHQGYRPVHARGIVCSGSFTATSAAASLSRAGHLRGSPIEATVRSPTPRVTRTRRTTTPAPVDSP
jgi:hypothetical protein